MKSMFCSKGSLLSILVLAGLAGCVSAEKRATSGGGGGSPPDVSSSSAGGGGASASLPLVEVADVPLPGAADRFDYEDIDAANGHLIIAHMNDASVVVANLADGSTVKVLPNVPVARGIVVAPEVNRFFVTSSPNTLVIYDSAALNEIGRVATGNAPDGDAWDGPDQIVAVSDQGDGAISLIPNAGSGTRSQVPLGVETGNVVYDKARGHFWISVVRSSPPDQLVEIAPLTASIVARIDLPGCNGAHGLRLHPDGQSAYVACEDNSKVARVDLGGSHQVVTANSGSGPDVLSLDPGLGWIYVAAESGDLAVFDMSKPGLTVLDREHAGPNAHSVAVDPATHNVFFPLMQGPSGKPVLRIMKPS
jgi:sugar lactone lactonase YvrE